MFLVYKLALTAVDNPMKIRPYSIYLTVDASWLVVGTVSMELYSYLCWSRLIPAGYELELGINNVFILSVIGHKAGTCTSHSWVFNT